jgi:hypothetical protein
MVAACLYKLQEAMYGSSSSSRLIFRVTLDSSNKRA